MSQIQWRTYAAPAGGGETEIKHNQAPTVPKKNLLCCGMLQAVGGGYPHFPKATTVAKPKTKHKGMHLPTPCNDEHNRVISWVVLMPSPIAHCKQL